jgi:hypothetical protein
MTTDREVVGDETPRRATSDGLTAAEAPAQRRLSRSTLLWCVAVAVLLVGWFLVAWLALDRHIIDAAGESIGSAFLLLVLASVVGAIRRGRR